MDYALLVCGIVVMLLTAYDIIYTALAPGGAGIITGTVSTIIWRSLMGLSRLFKFSGIMDLAGVLIVVAVLLNWVLLLWAGNALIYLSDTDAVLNSTSKVPAGLVERIYFTGYNLSTMGNGDYMAGTDAWRIYTAFISFSGLILITTAITYIVPVLSAVTERRALSIRIASVGCGPQQMLLNSWNGKDFKQLESHLDGLAQPIAQQGQLHLAYPILHFFHHSEKVVAMLPNLTALDEAITLLLLFVPEDKRPSNQVLIPVRQAITTFLRSLEAIYINPDRAQEPPYDIRKLEQANVPLLKPDVYLLEQLNTRRRTLKALLDYDGWDWEELDDPVISSEIDLPEMR